MSQETHVIDAYAGVDVGTTYGLSYKKFPFHSMCANFATHSYSGVSFAISGDPSIRMVLQRPSSRNPRSLDVKVPSILHFSPDGTVTCGDICGDDARDGSISVELFKLHIPHWENLPEDVRQSPKFQKSLQQSKELGLTAVDATAAYLSLLWKPCLERILLAVSKEGKHMQCRLHITMTVPAGWPEDARHRMRDAVVRAGMLSPNNQPTFTFLSEPEAALIALLSSGGARTAQPEVHLPRDLPPPQIPVYYFSDWG